jgi:hypothetical protein
LRKSGSVLRKSGLFVRTKKVFVRTNGVPPSRATERECSAERV